MIKNVLVRILDFIGQNFHKDLNLEEIASVANMSKFHFSRLFKKYVGTTFVDYLTQLRIQNAKELLERQSILETTFDVGYESVAHFTRTFKRLTGMTPGAYQKLIGKKAVQDIVPFRKIVESEFPIQGTSLVEQFLGKIIELLQNIKDREGEKIADIADRAAFALQNGRQVYGEITMGHMLPDETARRRPGNPNFIPQHVWFKRKLTCGRYDKRKRAIILFPQDWLDGHPGYDQLKQGDVLITNYPIQHVLNLKKRGVYVAGVACPYIYNQETPKGKVLPSPSHLSIEEVAQTVLYLHTPWNVGLVRVPEIPLVPIGPGTGIAQTAVYWSLTAGIASRQFHPGHRWETDYLDMAISRVENLKKNVPHIQRVAARLAERTIRGGKLFVAGAPSMVKESYWRASGLMGIEPLKDQKVKRGDSIVVAVFHLNDHAVADAVNRGRKEGAYVVALGSAKDYLREGVASGHRADDVLDTFSPEPAGIFAAPGFAENICPVNGLVLATLLWMLYVGYFEEMRRRGNVPYLWMGFHLVGGKEYDEAIYPYYLERGY